MKPTVLFDASNAWYRAYTATYLDPPGGPLLIFCGMLRKLCKERGKDNLIICWDAGDGGRSALDPAYKAQRKHVKGVWEDLKLAKQMVKNLGIKTAITAGFEADDTIGSLAMSIDKDVLIVSYDKDFYQLVDERIKILKPARKMHGKEYPEEIIDRNAVIVDFGCAPERVALLKAFRGDASDNIPKLGIRFTKSFKEAFFRVVPLAETVDHFYQHIANFEDKYHHELLEFKDRAKLNHKMTTIQTHLKPTQESTVLDEEAAQKLCNEVNIKSISLNEWRHLSSTDVQAEMNAKSAVQRGLFD